ncbi:hypothetical protein L195_g060386, partial [Trifolium pratense]
MALESHPRARYWI